jgi:hypothetical protein
LHREGKYPKAISKSIKSANARDNACLQHGIGVVQQQISSSGNQSGINAIEV